MMALVPVGLGQGMATRHAARRLLWWACSIIIFLGHVALLRPILDRLRRLSILFATDFGPPLEWVVVVVIEPPQN